MFATILIALVLCFIVIPFCIVMVEPIRLIIQCRRILRDIHNQESDREI